MDRIFCTHEPDNQGGSIGYWIKDYFCNVCNTNVGYFSRLIWRKSLFQEVPKKGLPDYAFKAFCRKCQTVHTTVICPK